MVDGPLFPDELDLRLRQKWYIARMCVEQYRDGVTSVAEFAKERADWLESHAENETQMAYAMGYAKLSADIQELLSAVDWEEAIIDVQTTILKAHDEDD